MVTINPPWTAVHDTPNKSIRQDVARRGVVLHHAAMTSLSTLRDMEVSGTKEVSSTAICKDDAIELVVSDNRYRPWSLSSSYWDSAMRSVETCNESTSGWTVSDKSHWSLARAVAYWSQTDGFWPHRDGDPATWTVIGHREVYSIHDASYATACPGGLDLGLVVTRAQSILNGTAPAGVGTSPLQEIKMPTLIKHPNNSIGYVSDAGELDPISDINEMNALVAVKLVGNTPLAVTSYIWDLLTRRTARLRALRSPDVDEAAVVAGVVPLLVPAVVAALQGVGSGLTTEQVAAVTEAAVRKVFGDAAA